MNNQFRIDFFGTISRMIIKCALCPWKIGISYEIPSMQVASGWSINILKYGSIISKNSSGGGGGPPDLLKISSILNSSSWPLPIDSSPSDASSSSETFSVSVYSADYC